MSILLVIFLYATWSSIFPLGKMALEHCPPVFLTSMRMLLAGLLLTGFVAIAKPKLLKMYKIQWISIILLAFFSIYLTNILEFWGLQHLTAAKTCFIYSLSPFFAAFFSYLHFKEKINKKKMLGLGIGFLGIMPVLIMQNGSDEFLKAFSFFSWPELAIVGAAMFSVYGWVLLRVIVKKHTISPIVANGSSMLIGGMFALAHSFFIDSWAPTPIETGFVGSFFKSIFLMTFISNIVCYNLYGYMLKKYTATFLSFVGLLSPIFASLTSWILLGEMPSLVILGSTCIVCIGLYIVYQAELKQGYIVKKDKESKLKPVSS